MASMACFSFLSLLLALSFSATAKQVYIVHMKHNTKPQSFATHHDWYSSSLKSITSTSDSLLYAYTTAFPGFAAFLDPQEVDFLRNSEAVLDVYEDTVYSLHTTRTPEFLGLNTDLGLFDGHNTLDIDQASHDVIIGCLTLGFGPSLGVSMTRGYHMATGGSYLKKPKEIESPRDQDGHGTHTASTAAGSQVANASLLGYASGTARGMATHARVASYKVCWNTGCFGSDILAGMDRAIEDGVDVLSLSLGGGSVPYYRDTIAIGAFAAMERGIFVSCSAGNSGPNKATLANVAPWIMTVGAGTLDRDFPAYALLGNNNRFTGVSLYSGTGMGNKQLGLVYNKGNSSSNLCLPGSLEPAFVRGKLVVCDRGINARVEKGAVVRDAGGIGMILANTEASGEELVADSHLLPAVAVGGRRVI
ncbi:hypothetical protein GH714_027279 [Hevea brasiliensis]|uniref:Peptidase S8/S53 domain-containing protein n=1 Tax=Hevea brasiliensis TaxID=3981 RepID=A0A6A6LVP1_HEVBR|nr:hypothetical protein GH714_027279 [Hevea brasiliensis]